MSRLATGLALAVLAASAGACVDTFEGMDIQITLDQGVRAYTGQRPG